MTPLTTCPDMRSHSRRNLTHVLTPAVAALVFLCVAFVPASAQEPPPDGWTFNGELTSVFSMGNAEALTFGLGTALENRRGPNLLKFEAGGIRTESVIVTRRAVGTPTDFVIEKDEDREKTAEAYYARARYDRALSARLFTYGGVDWMRNTFAGIDSRFLVAAGAGNIWFDREDSRFRTDYAITYTFQSDVVENPFISTNFPGVRAGWEYWRRFTATTEFDSRLVGDLNLDESDDVRVDFTNSVAVSISDALALKPSLQLLWRNLPALAETPLFGPGGEDLGQTVTSPLEKSDLLFRLALVVKL